MSERAFIMIKPDHIGLAEEILSELDKYGKRIKQATITKIPKEVIEDHYSVHKERPFFRHMTASFVDQPTIIAVYKGENIIEKLREAIGPTDPTEASKTTIRGKYSDDSLEKAIKKGRPVKNVIHCSDSPEEYKREISVWKSYFE